METSIQISLAPVERKFISAYIYGSFQSYQECHVSVDLLAMKGAPVDDPNGYSSVPTFQSCQDCNVSFDLLAMQ